jgi:hypothetical protein
VTDSKNLKDNENNPADQAGNRTGEGASSALPHLQKQTQSRIPAGPQDDFPEAPAQEDDRPIDNHPPRA